VQRTATYTIDVKLPGLLAAVIAWPPSFGAKLVSFDATDAKNVKGVTTSWKYRKAWRWSPQARGPRSRAGGRSRCSGTSQRAMSSIGGVAGPLSRAGRATGTPFTKPRRRPPRLAPVKTIEAVYEFPFLAHASMEADELRRMAARRHARNVVGAPVPDVRPHARREGGRAAEDKVKLHTRSCRAAALAGAPTCGATSPSLRQCPKAIGAARRCACSSAGRTTRALGSTGRCTSRQSRWGSTRRPCCNVAAHSRRPSTWPADRWPR